MPLVRPRLHYAFDRYQAAGLSWYSGRYRSPDFPASVDHFARARNAATHLILALRLMNRCHSDRIKTRAGVQDDSGILILGLILLAIFSSFSAIFGLLSEAKHASSHDKLLTWGWPPVQSSCLGW